VRKETRLVFIDLETTGLDSALHEIVEFAAIVTDLKLKEVGRFVYKVLPQHIETAEPEALKANGYDAEVWKKEGVQITRALQLINRLVPKKQRGIVVGHNVKTFDLPFVRKAYAETKLFDPLSHYTIDTLDLAVAYCIASGIKLPNLKLTTLVNHFGLTNLSVHHAMYDVSVTMEVFKEIVGYLRMGFQDCHEEKCAV